MFFLYDANLKLLKTIPSDVYQGSDGADDIYFLVPINPNAAINVAFLLPTGKTLTSRAATKQGEAVGLETPDGISYAMWSITLTAQETAYAGNVTLQITVISGAMRMTSQKGVFPVLTGVPPVLPEAPQADAYNDIRAAIAALQTAVYNTKAIGISTYSYNESKKHASIKSYVTSATRVVVPDYVIKGDEYYIVTGIDTNVKPPTSVTEYEFGSNITSIGAGAFMETKIKSLEFPKNLTSIGASAFTDATTREFVFNGAVPTIGSFAFSGVNATVYVPTVYYDDYVAAFDNKTYPGIVVEKKSETLADVIKTADEAKAIALKAQSTAEAAQQTADEVKTELDGKVDKTSIAQGTGNAENKVMSQKAATDNFVKKLPPSSETCRVYAFGENIAALGYLDVQNKAKPATVVNRDNDCTFEIGDAVKDTQPVTLGQLTTKLLNYLLKSGGIISGNLSIQGDLEVRGTTKTTEEETLNVKDSIVVTNSSGADLSSTLAGFVIRLNATDCYGIIYDASSESVKLGKGKITNGKFTFNEGEGNAVAVRADGSLMTNGHLVKWDATALKFVDAGKSVDDIKSDTLAALTEGDNISITKATDSEKVTISATGLVKQVRVQTGALNNAYVYDAGAHIDKTIPVLSGDASDNSIVMRNSRGAAKVFDPTDPLDAVNKQYFEANGLVCTNLSMNQNITITYLKSLTPGVYYKSIDYKFTGFDYNPTENYGHLIWFGNDKALFYPAFSDGFYILRSKTEGEGGGFTWIKLATTSDITTAINGQSFKTINGESIKGSGNIAIGGVSSINGKTGDITLGDGLTIIEQTLKCTNIGSVRSETSSDLILQFMGDGGNSVPYGFYAPRTSPMGDITPTDPTFEEFMGTDIAVFTSVYLYERVTETDSSKLIKNETPLILTRGDNGFSGAVLMKAPALNDTDSDVYFIMNVSWADGGTMLAQINGLRLDLRVTNNENGEFVGHIIIPSAKWAEGTITFETESLLASGLNYRELPSIFANQNSVYIFRQEWNTESDFQGIVILRADSIDGSYSPVSQGNASIDIVPYSI